MMEDKKQTYTRAEVKEIIGNVLECYEEKNEWVEYRFEEWLNDQGLNGNNWDNSEKYAYFFEDEIESYL